MVTEILVDAPLRLVGPAELGKQVDARLDERATHLTG